ncbi:MAG TPA: hypothetical protein VHA37_03010 [Candidatus Saccharimonadales bacterium]|nr:hypothetical protein [Candidatus Saccharimonadales bacterium]
MRRFVALLGAASVGVQPLIASAAAAAEPSKPTWSIQILAGDGGVMSIPALPRGAFKNVLASQVSEGDLERARQDLTGLKFSLDSRAAAWAERMLKILDVVTARSSVERHAKVLQLHVAVRTEAATDGRDGIIKTFIAGGLPRLRVFVPTPTASITATRAARTASASGPFVEENDGRWKDDGQGGCYWDPYDSGPDQCNPSGGRWKSDGSGGCYFADDSGPDQCTPPDTGQMCTDEYYGTGPCATQQEINDAQATLAAMQAEADQYQATYDAEYADLVDYCNQYPGNCDDEQTGVPRFGPSAVEGRGGCWSEAASAATYVGGLSGWIWGAGTAASTGITTGGLAIVLGATFAAGWQAGTAIRAFLVCKGALPKLGSQESDLCPGRPALWLRESDSPPHLGF